MKHSKTDVTESKRPEGYAGIIKEFAGHIRMHHDHITAKLFRKKGWMANFRANTCLHGPQFGCILVITTPATLLSLFRQASAPGGFSIWGRT